MARQIFPSRESQSGRKEYYKEKGGFLWKIRKKRRVYAVKISVPWTHYSAEKEENILKAAETMKDTEATRGTESMRGAETMRDTEAMEAAEGTSAMGSITAAECGMATRTIRRIP